MKGNEPMKNNKSIQLFTAILSGILLVIGLILSVANYSDREEGKAYSIGLIIVLLGVIALLSTIFSLTRKKSSSTNVTILAQAALLAALCYIGAGYLKIDIPVGDDKTMFHLGNVFCVLAALLIGGFWGGMSGAIGMTLSDLMTGYVTSAPKTFLLKLCIGLIVGFVAHKIFKLSAEHSKKQITVYTAISCAAGMLFNIIAEPIISYFYKLYLFGLPQDAAKILAKMTAVTTAVNAVIAVIVASLIYIALRPALKKSGLFKEF